VTLHKVGISPRKGEKIRLLVSTTPSTPSLFLATFVLGIFFDIFFTMSRVARYARLTYYGSISTARTTFVPNSAKSSWFIPQGNRCHATVAPRIVPHLEAPDLRHAKEPSHVHQVSEQLQKSGMLKISLQFPDQDSEYLQQLLHSLHQSHGHQLPITHSGPREVPYWWVMRNENLQWLEVNMHDLSSFLLSFDIDFAFHPDQSVMRVEKSLIKTHDT
jgi:hypothetical protein